MNDNIIIEVNYKPIVPFLAFISILIIMFGYVGYLTTSLVLFANAIGMLAVRFSYRGIFLNDNELVFKTWFATKIIIPIENIDNVRLNITNSEERLTFEINKNSVIKRYSINPNAYVVTLNENTECTLIQVLPVLQEVEGFAKKNNLSFRTIEKSKEESNSNTKIRVKFLLYIFIVFIFIFIIIRSL